MKTIEFDDRQEFAEYLSKFFSKQDNVMFWFGNDATLDEQLFYPNLIDEPEGYYNVAHDFERICGNLQNERKVSYDNTLYILNN